MRRTLIVFLPLILFAGILYGEMQKKKPVLLGMTTALTGPTSFLGQQMQAGVEVYFHHINHEGGINGRSIELLVLDDGYRKDIAVKNMNCLINENVMAIIGNVGTPTAIVTMDIAGEHQRLFFGAYTGTARLRNNFGSLSYPPDHFAHVVNYRAGYYDELEKIICELLKQGICPSEIGLFAQKGEWGDELITHMLSIYKAKGCSFSNPTVGLYTRNTSDIKDAVFKLIEHKKQLKAIILAGSHIPSAKCLKTLKPILPNAFFFGLSFIGAESFVKELNEQANNVIITQVVPPLSSNTPVIQDFRKDLKRYSQYFDFKANDESGTESDAFFTHVALEGYIAAQILTQILKKTDDLDDPQSLIDAVDKFKGKPLHIGIFEDEKNSGKNVHALKWDPSKRQFSNYVWTVIVKNGRLEMFDWNNLMEINDKNKNVSISN